MRNPMKKTVTLFLHAGYWLLYFLLLFGLLLAMSAGSNRFTPGLIQLMKLLFLSPLTVLTIGTALLSFYAFYFFLFDKFLKRRKILALIVAGILVSMISAIIPETFLSVFVNPLILFADHWNSAITITIVISILALIHGIIALVMRGFISWYGDIKLKEELTQKNFEMEMALVKSQLNPHFLFNTLNNIDVLIEKDAKKASAYLNKLSGIMRFMLYETKTERILFSKELNYIEEYISLQKIRTSNPDYIQYSVKGDAEGMLIEPMLFVPFIENAFKHSENKKSSNTISIDFEIAPDKIIFNCKNHFTQKQKGDEQGGLGNELIKKRLALLYPGMHTLDVTSADEVYHVKLTIRRNEN
ncbi:hypothetical protein BH11BAC7_BH11BAC7_29610 [soil metagenome]